MKNHNLPTGNKISAGTTSQVFIKVQGSLAATDEIPLLSNRFGTFTFTTASAQSFEHKCAKHLGDLEQITLSINNVGLYPSWNCRKVRIKDVDQKKEYIFIVGKWFARKNVTDLAFTINVATIKQMKGFKFLFFEYFELFASNVWIWRILSPNHEGNLNRKERIILLYVKVILSACFMAMFFGKTKLETAESENANNNLFFLNIGRTIYVLFISSAVTSLISSIIEALFRYSKYVHETYQVYTKEDDEEAVVN